MNMQKNDTISIYLSSSGDVKDDTCFQSFLKAFKSMSQIEHTIKRRLNEKSIDKIETSISKTHVLIAFITKSYLKSDLAKDEFNYAVNIQLPCLYIMSKNLKDSNEQIVNIVKAFNTRIEVDLSENFKWTAELISQIDEKIAKLVGYVIEKPIYVENKIARPNMSNLDAIRLYISTGVNVVDNASMEKFQTKMLALGNRFSIRRRTNTLKGDEIIRLIDNCDVFIAYVTNYYFHSTNLIEEFDYAFEIRKPIVFIFQDGLNEHLENDYLNREKFALMKTFENHVWVRSQDENEWGNIVIAKIINIIEKLTFKNVQETVNSHVAVNVVNETKCNSLSIMPNSFDIQTLRFLKSKIPEGLYGRGVILDANTIAIITLLDSGYVIVIIDLELNILTVHDANDFLKLKEPTLIAMNKNNEIIVFDEFTGNFHVFSKNFEKKLYIIPTNLKFYNDMTVDLDTNDIYVAKCVQPVNIKVIECNNNDIKDVIWKNGVVDMHTFYPRTLKVLNDKIYIVNACSFKMNVEARILQDIKFGDSCIYVLDKKSFNLFKKIDLKNYSLLQPWSLIVDQNMNIYTTAYSVDYRKGEISEKRFLCKIWPNGELTVRELSRCFLANDMLYVKNSLILFKENEIDLYRA